MGLRDQTMVRTNLRIVHAACGILAVAAAAGAQTSAYLPLMPGVSVEEYPSNSVHVQKVGVSCRGIDDLALVVWSHPYGASVEGRLFVGQNPLGGQIQVGNTGTGMPPAVGLDNTGSFVVTWVSPSDDTVRRRRLDGTTLTWGPELLITRPNARSVSLGPDGGFAVTWVQDTLLKGQRYDSGGSPVGQTFEVVWPTHDPVEWDNSVTDESVVISSDGATAMVWATSATRHSNGDRHTSIKAQRFDPAGSAIGAVIVVASGFAPYFTGFLWEAVTNPHTAPDGAGGVFVLYNDMYWNIDNAIEWDRVRANHYDADGSPLLSNVFVTSPDCFSCFQHGFAATAWGDFMAMWSGLSACRYPAAGPTCDPAFRVSDHPPVDGLHPSDVAYCGSTSDIVTVWVSDDCGGAGSNYCLWARWFVSSPEIFADDFETGGLTAWSIAHPSRSRPPRSAPTTRNRRPKGGSWSLR